MYKILFSLTAFLLPFTAAFAQKVHYVQLPGEEIILPDRQFYVGNVVDERYSKQNLGWIAEGFLNSQKPVDFENSLSFTLESFFRQSLPAKNEQVPVTVVFKVLKTSEDSRSKVPNVSADARVEFHHNGQQLFTTDEHVENTGADVHTLMEQSLRDVIVQSLESFNESSWFEQVEEQLPATVIDNKFENPDYAYFATENKDTVPSGPITYSEEELREMVPRTRDVFVVGLGIGGLSLIGVNYEVRLTDLLGIHGGIGYLTTDFFGHSYFSYTGGIKIHTGDTKNHPFFNLSYKDAGFGLMGAGVVEYGDRIVFSKKKDFGMVWQAGLGVVTQIDEELGNYYGENVILLISAGVGLSFNIVR